MTNGSPSLEGLSPQKRALLEALIKERQSERVSAGAEQRLPQIVPDPQQRYAPFPLTDMQQAYWIGRSSAFAMGNVATHMYEEFEASTIDLERLESAWQRLISQHDMLRAVVLPDGRQQILEQVPPYQIVVTDMRGRPETAIEAHLAATRQRMSHQVLPVDQWPLFELHATWLGEQHYRVHISIDGLLLDGWSYQLLFREWVALYEQPAATPEPLDISFRDYVLAEHALRSAPDYERALRYWRERLPVLPPAPQLPLAQAPELLTDPRFARRQHRVEVPVWGRIKARAAQAGLSPTSLLLAVYAEVLSTWSKSARFCLNVPRFNRLPLHPQVNKVLGEFASFTLLEVDNREDAPFEQRARRLQAQLWKDLDHQQVSGVQVLRELAQLHGGSGALLMPIVFTSMPHAVDAEQAALPFTLSDQAVYGITQTSQVWLDYQGVEEAGALIFNWDSVEELFPAGMLDAMFGAFCGFLARLAEDEHAWQERRPQLVPQEQLDQQARINATAALLPARLLQDLFFEQVERQPDHPAVIASGHALSYAELARQANRLGSHLRALGARPNTLVAVVMEKGWEQIVGVLGTLVAGAAYLPIDSALPAERLRYLLEHSQVAIVLTQTWLDQSLDWPDNVRRVPVDQEDFGDHDGGPLAPAQTPDDLAYVIYTSGSTGLPKGTMIAHAGVVNSVLATNARFAVGPNDRVLALTALHHDMSVYDIFGLLAAGGTLVMPNSGAARNPTGWVRLMAREHVTIWNSVPALMEMLIAHVDGRPAVLPDSLRLAFLGGDWLPLTLPSRLQAVTGDVQLVSVGGPTETTLWNIWYPVAQVDPTWKSIPYGQPIANTSYFILNENGQPCPVWTPGVMHCAGVGVAVGYWRDPAKTAERFMPNPFVERGGEGERGRGGDSTPDVPLPPSSIFHPPSSRLYRTGDLGRYLPDGTIEFLGREDFQVKIQGMRIELGEIEATLAQHPLVRASAVVVDDQPGGKQLVAYVVLDAALGGVPQVGDFLEHPEQADAVILDRTERLQFKLEQRGLRTSAVGDQVFQLERPAPDDALLERYAARRSYRRFSADAIPLAAFSTFLSCLSQIELPGLPLPKYLYPSSGGLYPVQLYLSIKPDRVADLPGGAYYYHPRDHQLVYLGEAAIDRSIHVATNLALFDESAFALYLVGQMDAIVPMYGRLAHDFCMLETGYMGQALMEAASEQQIGLCPVGSIQFAHLGGLFGLGEGHQLLHSMLGGPIAPQQRLPAAVAQELAAASLSSQDGPADGSATHVAALQSFLSQKLPQHMVPATITLLERLPLTPNGKVDRRALSQMQHTPQQSDQPYTKPRNELEQLIADTWISVLQIERIGVHDNLFNYNTNSLQLVRVHTILQKELGREINVVDLFHHSTIAGLAEALNSADSAAEQGQANYNQAELRANRRKRARPVRVKRGAGEPTDE